MLTDLADVARGAGLTVAEVDGWRTRGHGEMRDIRTVTVHHTAGPATGAAPSLRTVVDGRPDLAGPLAHYLIGRSGTVHVVAAGLCWHTGATLQPWQANAYSIGLELENSGTVADRYPPAQLDALRRLCRALCDHYDIPTARVLGHREICDPPGRKPDPLPATLDMRAFRLALTQESPMTNPMQWTSTPVSIPQCKADPTAVWTQLAVNFAGDAVTTLQILNGVEQRLSDLQKAVAELHDRLDEKAGGKL